MNSQRMILAAFVTLHTGVASAQASTGFDPLNIPGPTLVCRSIPVDPADSAAFAFEYIDGSDPTGTRISLVAFDSVGAPIFMMVHAPTTNANGERRMHVVAAQFLPKRVGGRVVITAPAPMGGAADSVALRKPAETTLTDAEITHAEKLAKWFWTHRCKDSAPKGEKA